MRLLTLALLLFWGTGMTAEAAPRPMVIEDLYRFLRVSDPQISPDGKHVVYALTTVNLDANQSSTALWLVALDKPGQAPRPLTNPNGKSDRHPRWSPDGSKILFESSRSGSNQIWVIDIQGGEARQLTSISTGASNALWSPDGTSIAFVSAVWPEYSDKPFADSDVLNKKRIDAAEQNPVKAKVFTKLFYRHWDEYVEDKRQHLFVMSATGGEPKDVTPIDRDAYPTSTTFSVGDDFTFSPDGKFLVFTAVPARDEAWSTNYDICRVPVTGAKEWETLTPDNPAADGAPRFAPNGKKLAYRAQKRHGYEADKWDIMVVDCDASGKPLSKPTNLTAKLDRSADDFIWQSDDTILFTAEENGTSPVWGIRVSDKTLMPNWHRSANGKEGNTAMPGTVSSLSVSKEGRIAFSWAFMNAPPEVYAQFSGLPVRPGSEQFYNVSKANEKLLSELELPRPDSVIVKGEGGTPMQMWILKPPGFDSRKKWPVAFLVHGGPQGAWNDGWSYRWNPQVWAAQGYIVALPNPRGSTGFGQQYVDEISGDWGGRCYQDLMAGADFMESLEYVDKDRIGSAGASFGGYMVNWFAVNTPRFKCLISHCGVYNFDSMYALTEELWFDEWEHGGPPWAGKRDSYEKHSPHKFAGNLGKFKTPTLIIHNDLDFRVPVAEGLQFFTALQRQGVKSRMVNFPDEGHWVAKPKNGQYWHREVFAWMKEFVPPGPK